jgi:hypothetical protein
MQRRLTTPPRATLTRSADSEAIVSEEESGNALVDAVLSLGKSGTPVLAINSLASQTASEHRGR